MNIDFWCGSLDSYKQYEASLKKSEAFLASKEDPSSVELPPLYERQGSVGVVKVVGNLVPGEAGFMRIFGITGYDDIKNAAMQAIQDKNAKSLLLYVESTGGAVSGVQSAGQVLKMMASLKPTVGYADLAASAGYWLFSTAPTLYGDSASLVGSIGVVKVHKEYTKLLADEGTTVTVMRSGKYKALENPYEVLSDEAKAEIQAKLDDMYGDFVADVASNRGTTPTIVDQNMAQGREFFGKRALEVGLIDQVGDLGVAMSFAAKNQRLARFSSSNFTASATSNVVTAGLLAHNAQNNCESSSNMTNNPVTPEQLAAIAVGIPVEAVQASQAQASVAGVADISEPVKESAPVESPAVEASASANEPGEVVAFLKQTLDDTNRKLFAADTANASFKSQVESLIATQTKLTAIVQDAVSNMAIALGKTPAKDLSTDDLISAHSSLTSTFKESFKGGKASASSASLVEPTLAKSTAEASTLSVDPLFIYAIKQTTTRK